MLAVAKSKEFPLIKLNIRPLNVFGSQVGPGCVVEKSNCMDVSLTSMAIKVTFSTLTTVSIPSLTINTGGVSTD